MFDSQAIIGEDLVIQPAKYEEGESHSLHKIFGLLSQGWSSKKIRKANPHILPETITIARGILIGRNEGRFPNTKNEKPFQDFKILIDENITPQVKGYLKRHFKKVSHVSDVGLLGVKDPDIWLWAINNNYDVIVTCDKHEWTENDLTYVAVDEARSIIRNMDARQHVNMTLAALPLLVHLVGGENADPETQLKRLLRKNKDGLFNYLDNRSTPYIDIRYGGRIDCGPTYLELRGKNSMEEQRQSPEQIESQKKEIKDRYKDEIYRRLTVEQIRKMSPEDERRIDNLVKAAAGMATREPKRLAHSGLGVKSPESWLP